jgi:hypothetical protein
MNTVILSAAESNWFDEDLTNRKIKTFQKQKNSKKQIFLRKRSKQKKFLKNLYTIPGLSQISKRCLKNLI